MQPESAKSRHHERLEALGRLAGGIAHDFNSLLTIILGYSDVLKNRPDADDASRHCADEIHAAASRAAELTQQLLAFGRGHDSPVTDLNAVVTSLDRTLRQLLGDDISLSLVLDEALWPAKADPRQLERIILSLVINACEAMPEGGRLTLQTTNSDGEPGARPGSFAVLTVADTGRGMDKETQARLFEPLFTGVGPHLATVHDALLKSGGDIKVLSRPGSGTTVRVYLPRADDA